MLSIALLLLSLNTKHISVIPADAEYELKSY